MNRTLASLAAALLLMHAGSQVASAEVTLSLNDNAWTDIVHDQPASVTSGATAHVAWIGSDNATNPFRLYYAAFNAAADFRNLSLTTATPGFFHVTPMPVVDNSTPSGETLADVRHPWIGLLGSDRVVILFQGKGSSDTQWGLYLATFLVRNKAVEGPVSVKKIGVGAGESSFPSGVVWPADRTVRIAYSFYPDSRPPGGRSDVRYVRVGVENGALLNAPVELSSWNDTIGLGNRGFLPLPSISLDPSGRSHVAWVSEGSETGLWRTSGVWYAMVAVTNGWDNVQIAATNVIGRNRSWSRPHSLAYDDKKVFVTAADNAFSPLSGSLSMVYLNPNEALRDGNPVNLSESRKFLLEPPGVQILPADFDLYLPTARVDKGGRIFIAGYGSATSPLTYLVVNPLATLSAQIVTSPTPAGFGVPSFAGSLPGDLTYPGLSFYSDRAFLFWSGYDNTVPDRRNLNVTSVFTTKQWVETDQTGCASSGAASFADLLPAGAALLLVLARVLRRNRRDQGTAG